MKIELDFNDRQYNDIELYCKTNNLEIQTYLIDIINEKHSINKFGDLNELIPKVLEESTVAVKKRGRPKKVVEGKTEAVVKKNEEPKEIIEETVKTKSESEEISQNTIKPTVKRKRTLKTL